MNGRGCYACLPHGITLLRINQQQTQKLRQFNINCHDNRYHFMTVPVICLYFLTVFMQSSGTRTNFDEICATKCRCINHLASKLTFQSWWPTASKKLANESWWSKVKCRKKIEVTFLSWPFATSSFLLKWFEYAMSKNNIFIFDE